MNPYYEDASVRLYHGDCREILPEIGEAFDLIVADPPYGETSLDWDVWPAGWPGFLAGYASSMWCFGSMRMFLEKYSELDDYWRLSQDVVWEKHNGSIFHNDRFRRVHEHALFWYRGAWRDRYHETPTTASARQKTVRRKERPTHSGDIGAGSYQSIDGGPLLMASVIYARSMHGQAINETEKPVSLLEPLIQYAMPPAGTVLDPFAGSGSTLVATRNRGGSAVGIEKRESQCEKAALRLSQGVLDFGGVS